MIAKIQNAKYCYTYLPVKSLYFTSARFTHNSIGKMGIGLSVFGWKTRTENHAKIKVSGRRAVILALDFA